MPDSVVLKDNMKGWVEFLIGIGLSEKSEQTWPANNCQWH